MADSETPAPKREHEIDWEVARSDLRARIRSQLGPCEPAQIEDLTQQALIGVLRLVRKEGARNLGGLIAVVARDTAIDEIRRRQRERAKVAGLKAQLEWTQARTSPEIEEWETSWEMLWFLLLEFFRSRKTSCLLLARAYAERGDWKRAAEALNLSHDATRQQWSRCVRAFREALKRDPGPFKDWLDDA